MRVESPQSFVVDDIFGVTRFLLRFFSLNPLPPRPPPPGIRRPWPLSFVTLGKKIKQNKGFEPVLGLRVLLQAGVP